MSRSLTQIWLEEFLNKDSKLCGLCANSGVIDTTGLHNCLGKETGIIAYCICPNGRVMRRVNKKIPLIKK